MELFLDNTPTIFEKIAAEVQLPEDPNQWPHEILQELHKQVSYISDFDPRIVMDRVDAEKGYGFGHFEIATKMSDPNASAQDKKDAGKRTARIPIIIEEGRLKPFDLVINQESKMLPLTEERLRQAMFRPQMFDTAKKGPGDQGIVERLYPPHQGSNYMGGASGGSDGGMVVQSEAGAEKEDIEKVGSKKFFGMGKEAMNKTAEEQFNDFVTGDQGENKDNQFEAWDGQKIETAGEMDQRRRVRAEGDLEQVQQLGEGAWGKVLSDQNREAMGMPLKGPISGTNDKANYDANAKRNHSIAGGQMKTAAKMMKIKTPEPDKIIEGQKADGRNGQYAGTMNADGSIKSASLLETILPTISRQQFEKMADGLTDEILVDVLRNTAAMESFGLLSDWEENKSASAIDFVRSNVTQIKKTASGYAVKSAANNCWEPRTVELDRGQAYAKFGSLMTDVDIHGCVTMTKGAMVTGDGPSAEMAEPIEHFGMYKVETTEGSKIVGYAIPNLIDLDGTVLPMVLFTNGSVSAVQGDMVGIRSGGEPNLPDGPARGNGCFVRITNEGKAEATVPVTVTTSMTQDGAQSWIGETMDGEKVTFKKQPGINMPARVDATVIIPETFRWMPLGGGSVSIVDRQEAFGKVAEAKRAVLAIRVIGDGGVFGVEGFPVEKLARVETQDLDIDQAAFLLGGLGIEAEYAMRKLGQANYAPEPVTIRIGRTIQTHGARMADAMKLATVSLEHFNSPELLLKEAAVIPDPTAVDTVLSLGFINPENIVDFVNALPRLEEAQQRMCELLLGARLGMKEVSEGSLEKSIRTTEDVIEGLKVLAFQEA